MDGKSQKVIEAFHLMWDFFPEPVGLIAKNRTVLAINRAAENVETGRAPSLQETPTTKTNDMSKKYKIHKSARAASPRRRDK
jgi:hypothetical protein